MKNLKCDFCPSDMPNITRYRHPLLQDAPICISCLAIFEGIKSSFGGAVGKQLLENMKPPKKPWEE